MAAETHLEVNIFFLLIFLSFFLVYFFLDCLLLFYMTENMVHGCRCSVLVVTYSFCALLMSSSPYS